MVGGGTCAPPAPAARADDAAAFTRARTKVERRWPSEKAAPGQSSPRWLPPSKAHPTSPPPSNLSPTANASSWSGSSTLVAAPGGMGARAPASAARGGASGRARPMRARERSLTTKRLLLGGRARRAGASPLPPPRAPSGESIASTAAARSPPASDTESGIGARGATGAAAASSMAAGRGVRGRGDGEGAAFARSAPTSRIIDGHPTHARERNAKRAAGTSRARGSARARSSREGRIAPRAAAPGRGARREEWRGWWWHRGGLGSPPGKKNGSRAHPPNTPLSLLCPQAKSMLAVQTKLGPRRRQ